MDFFEILEGGVMRGTGNFATSVSDSNPSVIGFHKLQTNGCFSEFAMYHRDCIPKIVEVLENTLQEFQEKSERKTLAFAGSPDNYVFACVVFGDRLMMFCGADDNFDDKWVFAADFTVEELHVIILHLKNYME